MKNLLEKASAGIGKALAVPIIVTLVAVFLWLPWLLIALVPVSTDRKARWWWALRAGFWNRWATLKFRSIKPVDIPVPGRLSRWQWLLMHVYDKRLTTIHRVPFQTIFHDIPISNIIVAGHVPGDEWDWKVKFFTWWQVLMYRLFPPMQPGLPAIPGDPYKALAQAYTERHRRVFQPPVMPLEHQGSPDLGSLAVKGPYACYLKRCGQNEYEWDFGNLKNHEYHDNVYKLGVRVLFRVDAATQMLRPSQIETELGVSKQGDATWEFAKKLALCAATNHLSLVRHFNGVHLAAGAHLAIATRNWLFPDHPLGRLLWPHIFRTQESNRAVTRAQMAKGGDFESIFSFTHRGMCDLFSAMYNQYKFLVNDPAKDAQDRGITDGGFETPTQNDLQRLFNLFRQHARDYIGIYYQSNAAIEEDEKIKRWLGELHATIPNGIKEVWNGEITCDSVANVVASFLYLVTVQHEFLGSFLWNYQLWANQQPTRVYRNGARVPLDVYQRLVNANFNLNVKRTPLICDPQRPPYRENYAYLALAGEKQTQAEAVFMGFQATMEALEAEWRREPWSVWRVYPQFLDVNING